MNGDLMSYSIRFELWYLRDEDYNIITFRCKKIRNHPFIKLCSSQIEYYEKYYKSWRIGGSEVMGRKAKGEKNKGRKRKVTIARQTMNYGEQGKRGILSQWMLEV